MKVCFNDYFNYNTTGIIIYYTACGSLNTVFSALALFVKS